MIMRYNSEYQLDEDDLDGLTVFCPDDVIEEGDGPVSFEAWLEIQAVTESLARDEDQARRMEQAMIQLISSEADRRGWTK